MAVPGLLLSGWAPARASGQTVRLLVRHSARLTPADEAMLAGVRLGIADVERLAAFTGSSVNVAFAALGEPADGSRSAIEVVVATRDDGRMPSAGVASRIYTCPLAESRADVWSVACQSPAWTWQAAREGRTASQLAARFQAASGLPMDEAAWRGWMAIKVAYDAALRAQAGEPDLRVLEFDGCKGQPLRFAADGHLDVRRQA